MTSDTEEAFLGCVDALDEVVSLFLMARAQQLRPHPCQADLTAYLLLEVVFRHINAVTEVAKIPYACSHLVSAIPLLRAAYETTLVAYWLVKPEDWAEREARWMGWMDKEIVEQGKLATRFEEFNASEGVARRKHIESLRDRRNIVSLTIPNASAIPMPNVFDLTTKCGIECRYYIFYSIGSGVMHGGEVVCRHLWHGDGKQVGIRDVTFREWAEWIRMASWCLAVSAPHVLVRMGVAQEKANEIYYAHKRLIAKVSVLDGREIGEEQE